MAIFTAKEETIEKQLEEALAKKVRPVLEKAFHKSLQFHFKELESGIEEKLRTIPFIEVELDLNLGFKEAKKAFKKSYLIKLLSLHGNVSPVAKIAGLRRESLHRLLRELKINPEELRERKSPGYLSSAVQEAIEAAIEQYKEFFPKGKYQLLYKQAPSLSKDIAKELPKPPSTLRSALREWEKAYLRAALEKNKGNISATARMIGLRFETLHRKMRRLGLLATVTKE